jgi:hypothetical protein
LIFRKRNHDVTETIPQPEIINADNLHTVFINKAYLSNMSSLRKKLAGKKEF